MFATQLRVISSYDKGWRFEIQEAATGKTVRRSGPVFQSRRDAEKAGGERAEIHRRVEAEWLNSDETWDAVYARMTSDTTAAERATGVQ